MKDNDIRMNRNERIDDLGIHHMKMIQNKDYFCFGMDSVLLANFVCSTRKTNVIVDLCSGAGVIPFILSAKKEYNKIFGVELQDEMFSLFERNIKLNHVKDKIIPMHEDIKQIEKIKENLRKVIHTMQVDVVVCNPPYKRKGTGIVNENQVKYIARHEVECTLEDVFATASALLKNKGKFYLVHKPERIVDLLSLARTYSLEAKRIRFVQPNKETKPSIVLIEYVKDGKMECKVENALIEYTDEGTYTDEILQIYGIKEIQIGRNRDEKRK